MPSIRFDCKGCSKPTVLENKANNVSLLLCENCRRLRRNEQRRLKRPKKGIPAGYAKYQIKGQWVWLPKKSKEEMKERAEEKRKARRKKKEKLNIVEKFIYPYSDFSEQQLIKLLFVANSELQHLTGMEKSKKEIEIHRIEVMLKIKQEQSE